MSTEPKAPRKCPGCDCALTHRNLYVCHECWRGLPKMLTTSYNQSRKLEDRRQAYREILRHFREEREQHRLAL